MAYDIDNIKNIRKQLGLTQTEFARAADVSQSLIAKIEAGKIDPAYSKVVQIFASLDRISKKKEISAREIMQHKLLTAKPEERIVDIVKAMHRRGISQVPVLEGKNVIGMVTERELLDKIGSPDVNQIKASDVMVSPPPIVSDETKISVLSTLIRHYPLLIVATKGEVVGVITKADIIHKMV